MEDLKLKHLRPCRRITDQFIIASALSIIIIMTAIIIFPIGDLLQRSNFFENILGGDHDAGVFLKDYFDFISMWIGIILVVVIFKYNRPMFKAFRYYSPRRPNSADASGRKANRPGNNFLGLLAGLALGFGCNGFCILMSSILGDIHLVYSGFQLWPFVIFFICVFIQSAAEELTDRWYLYQKLRRRYKAPWIAIVVNSLVFASLHLLNPGISIMSVIQIILVGVVFSLFVYYYNGLWIAAAFHAAWNFTQSIFFGLPNSGIVSAYSVFRLDAASATNGPFYNVNFGVEGSPGAVVILAALGIVIILINRGKGEQTDIWADAEREAIEKASQASA